MVSSHDLDHGAVGEHSTVLLLGFPEATVVYYGAVGRRVLQHDDAIASQVDPKVCVGHPFGFIIDSQENIATGAVATKAEPHTEVAYLG